jgi:hypothetical protein
MRCTWHNIPNALALICLFAPFSMAQTANPNCKLEPTDQAAAICNSRKVKAANDKLTATFNASLKGLLPDTAKALRADKALWPRYAAFTCYSAIDSDRASCMVKVSTELENTIRDWQRSHNIVFVTRTKIYEVYKHYEEAASDMAWPRADSDSSEWRSWNAQIEKMMLHDIITSIDAREEITKRAYIEYVGQGRVSAHIEKRILPRNMAHFEIDILNFHWLLSKKREMKADDVFKPGSGWMKFIEDYCEDALIKAHTSAGDIGDHAYRPTDETTQVTRNWKLEPVGLTFNVPDFPMGMDIGVVIEPVTIPWSKLLPYLQPSFSLPQDNFVVSHSSGQEMPSVEEESE